MFTQIKDIKHIEQNFYSVVRVMPRSGTWGCWRESKTLVWGFAMAPHGLRDLGTVVFEVNVTLHSFRSFNQFDFIIG